MAAFGAGDKLHWTRMAVPRAPSLSRVNSQRLNSIVQDLVVLDEVDVVGLQPSQRLVDLPVAPGLR